MRSRPRLLFLLGPVCALAFVVVMLGRGHADLTPPPEAASPLPHASASTPGTGSAEVVTVGLYMENIHEIDIRSNSFTAEFYVWFRWRGDLDPTLSYEIGNVVSPGDLSKVPIYTDGSGSPVADDQPDGYKLQTFHVHGRFGRPFPLAKYPFDAHDIVISIEDARTTNDRLVFEVDRAGTGIRPDLQIPGWKRSAMTTHVGTTQFATTFGDAHSSPAKEVYSHVDFAIHIDRPVVGVVSKTIIPIALIILITFGAFFCQPTDIDARLCLTITALISAVALQITAATELPPTGSLLLLDEIYILSYAAILAVTFICIGVNRLAHAEKLETAHAVDHWSLLIVGTGYFGGLAVLVVLTI